MISIFALPRPAATWRITMALAAFGAQAFAQTNAAVFVPFDRFMENTRQVSAGAMMSMPGAKVKDANALQQMRIAITNRYAGVKVSHSFLLDGQHYDCVPLAQQPAMRTYGMKQIAAAPPMDLLKHQTVPSSDNVKPATHIDASREMDAFGHSTSCEAGTVPLLRIELETMSRFGSLAEFYHKTSSQQQPANGSAHSGFADPAVTSHKYSYTYQNVNNLGGNSNINIWSPYVSTGSGEIFSLSQEWYIGGSGAGLQTEEVGWVVYPAMFNGDERAHFFIFSTADDYASGCWNNSCGDFVQVASSGLLGASFSNYSTLSGTQYEFSAEYYLYQGNWWLAYQGTWVGYYPGAKYHGGQLTRYAQTIEFGSEGVGSTIWPPEGSGQWSYTGFGRAAYQRNLWYISTSGPSYWDSLTAVSPSPRDYSISGPYTSSSSGWTEYFYEGGPGGIY